MAKDNFQKLLDEISEFIKDKRRETMESFVQIGELVEERRDAQESYIYNRAGSEIRSEVLKLINKYFPEQKKFKELL